MKFRYPALWSAVLACALVNALPACGERSSGRFIGDAVPRSATQSSLLEVVRPLLREGPDAAAEIKPWTATSPDLGIGETEQAGTFIDDPSVVAVVGHAGSKGTLLTKPLYAAAGMPLIVPTSTARAIGDPVAGIFTLAPPDDVIGAFLIDEAIDRLHARRVAVIHVADPYGNGVRNGITERVQQRGDSLVGSAALSGRECEVDVLAMDAIVRAFLQRTRPDAVILVLPQRATWCAIRRLVHEQPQIIVIASDSYTMSNESMLTADERAHVHSLVFWQPGTDSLSQKFIARTREVFKRDPDAGEALTFDAFRLIDAAMRSGNTTRSAVSNWLRQLGTDGHPPFPGITGPIDFRSPRKSLLHLKALADSAGTP